MVSASSKTGLPAASVALDILVEAGEWPGETSLEALAARAVGAALEELGLAEQSATPPHPASASLGHPLPDGERRFSAASAKLESDRPQRSSTSSPQRGEVARAKRGVGEGALPIAPPSELSLVFTDDAHIQVLNSEWRGKDKPTNVLSFPAFPPVKGGARLPPMLGDVVLAFETVAREAELEEKPFDHHLSHLLVHGLLHLLGYDHETEGQAEEMEGLEKRVLARLAIGDPYA